MYVVVRVLVCRVQPSNNPRKVNFIEKPLKSYFSIHFTATALKFKYVIVKVWVITGCAFLGCHPIILDVNPFLSLRMQF